MKRKVGLLSQDLRTLKTDLDVIHRLLALEDEGYAITCAIDFSELFAHAFPLTSAMTRWKRAFRPHLEDETRLQVSLSYLLDEDRDVCDPGLLILHPHLVELSNVLTAMSRSSYSLVRSTSYLAGDIVKELVENLGGETAIAQFLSEHASNPGYLSGSLQKFLSSAGDQFDHILALFSLMSGDTETGFTRIRNLLATKAVVTTEEKWPNIRFSHSRIRRFARGWIQRIQQARRNDREERHHSTWTDGFAIAHLLELNARIAENKQVAVLVTHSRSILEATRSATLAVVRKDLDVNLPLVLSPDWAAIYLIHQSGLKDRTRELLGETNRLLEAAVNARDEFSELWADEKTASRNATARILEVELKAREHLASVEERALASQANRYSQIFRKAIMVKQQSHLALIRKVSEACRHENVSNFLAKSAAIDLEKFPAILKDVFTTMAIASFDLDEAQTLLATPYGEVMADAFSKVVLSGDIREIPYTIQFREGRTQQALIRMIDLLGRSRALEAFHELVRMIEETNQGSEGQLLVAYLLYSLGHSHRALLAIEIGLEARGTKHELSFLKAIILRNNEEYALALEACENALEYKQEWAAVANMVDTRDDDPRYFNEMSVIRHRLACETGKDEVAQEHLREAIRHAERTFELADADVALWIRALNNEAFYLIDLNTHLPSSDLLARARLSCRKMLEEYRNHRDDPRVIMRQDYLDTLLLVRLKEEEIKVQPDLRLLHAIGRGFCYIASLGEPNSYASREASKHAELADFLFSRAYGP